MGNYWHGYREAIDIDSDFRRVLSTLPGLAPFLQPLAVKYADRLSFAKCNPDKIAEKSMEEMDVDGVPTMLFVFNEEILDQYDGFDGDIEDVHVFLEHNLKEWKKELN